MASLLVVSFLYFHHEIWALSVLVRVLSDIILYFFCQEVISQVQFISQPEYVAWGSFL